MCGAVTLHGASVLQQAVLAKLVYNVIQLCFESAVI